jgi:hypothetical protein
MSHEKIKHITEYPNEDEFWGRFYALIHELAEDVRRKNGTNKVQDNRPKDNNRPSREKKTTRKAL